MTRNNNKKSTDITFFVYMRVYVCMCACEYTNRKTV